MLWNDDEPHVSSVVIIWQREWAVASEPPFFLNIATTDILEGSLYMPSEFHILRGHLIHKKHGMTEPLPHAKQNNKSVFVKS